jgi:hypothetical protein
MNKLFLLLSSIAIGLVCNGMLVYKTYSQHQQNMNLLTEKQFSLSSDIEVIKEPNTKTWIECELQRNPKKSGPVIGMLVITKPIDEKSTVVCMELLTRDQTELPETVQKQIDRYSQSNE